MKPALHCLAEKLGCSTIAGVLVCPESSCWRQLQMNIALQEGLFAQDSLLAAVACSQGRGMGLTAYRFMPVKAVKTAAPPRISMADTCSRNQSARSSLLCHSPGVNRPQEGGLAVSHVCVCMCMHVRERMLSVHAHLQGLWGPGSLSSNSI